MEDIVLANALSIREYGKDEYWLQDQIYANPQCLGLGDLESIDKERRQSSGGRLDILLKNPEDDSMYEVEVMLGETDESHIIRTIEYWDNEKRRWPQRQHYAVLVAESINRRFFNVIQLLSYSIPIIAIQVAILEANGQRSLYFTKVLDTFEEIDDGTSLDNKVYDESYWQAKAAWVIDTARHIQQKFPDILGDSALNFTKNYIAVTVHGNSYLFLHKRSAGKVLFNFRVPVDKMDDAKQLLDDANVSFSQKRKSLRLTTDIKSIDQAEQIYQKMVSLAADTWKNKT